MKKELDERHSPTCQTYFDGLSKSWELKYAPDGSMVRRLASIVRELKRHAPRGGTILDIGCGTGDISAQVGAAGYKVNAVDVSRKMIERAKSRFCIEGVEFSWCADTCKLPFPDEIFDAIVASSVLEYVGPLQAHLEELHRVCKVGGRAIMTVPNMTHPIRWIEAVEARLAIPLQGRFPRSYRARGEYLLLSKNRFRAADWISRLRLAGWEAVSTKRRGGPLRLLVAEKGATIAANCPKPV